MTEQHDDNLRDINRNIVSVTISEIPSPEEVDAYEYLENRFLEAFGPVALSGKDPSLWVEDLPF